MFDLPELRFEKDSMPDFSSAETFEYHHGKHHAAYVNKLNDAIKGTEYEDKTLQEVILKSHEEKNATVFNNAAQHWNHSFFWNCLTPDGGQPEGKLLEKIEESFRSFDELKKQFSEKAKTFFGSGWIWLVEDEDGKLLIHTTQNAETHLTDYPKALLTIDVWEHAYYIDFRNDRGSYIDTFWRYVNWKDMNTMYS